jgi:hypothetical protein
LDTFIPRKQNLSKIELFCFNSKNFVNEDMDDQFTPDNLQQALSDSIAGARLEVTSMIGELEVYGDYEEPYTTDFGGVLNRLDAITEDVKAGSIMKTLRSARPEMKDPIKAELLAYEQAPKQRVFVSPAEFQEICPSDGPPSTAPKFLETASEVINARQAMRDIMTEVALAVRVVLFPTS